MFFLFTGCNFYCAYNLELVEYGNCVLITFSFLQARALISRLTEEKNNAIQQISKLRQELVRIHHIIILYILLLFHHFMLRLILLLPSTRSFNISYGRETLIERISLLLVGAAETWRQQKSWWSVIYLCHINWLTWHNHGVSHEEDLRIWSIWFHHRFLLYSWLFKQLWWKLK